MGCPIECGLQARVSSLFPLLMAVHWEGHINWKFKNQTSWVEGGLLNQWPRGLSQFKAWDTLLYLCIKSTYLLHRIFLCDILKYPWHFDSDIYYWQFFVVMGTSRGLFWKTIANTTKPIIKVIVWRTFKSDFFCGTLFFQNGTASRKILRETKTHIFNSYRMNMQT